MYKVTTCILARDAGQYIERALLTASHGDKIIVMDHGSTDLTVSLARAYNADIMHWPSTEEMNFSEARNRMAWSGNNDIIFMLDADEFVNPLCYEYIRNTMSNGHHGVMSLRLLESYSPGYCDAELLLVDKVRVYDRRYCMWSGKIHEHLVGLGLDYGSKNIPYGLWHRGFKYSWGSLWAKILFYNRTMKRTDSKYYDIKFWEDEYNRIYNNQIRVPDDDEYKFVMDFFRVHKWKTIDVIDRR